MAWCACEARRVVWVIVKYNNQSKRTGGEELCGSGLNQSSSSDPLDSGGNRPPMETRRKAKTRSLREGRAVATHFMGTASLQHKVTMSR